MKTLTPLLILLFTASGCTPIMNAANPPGTLHPDGSITPCHGYALDHQACGNAIHNAKVINQVELGQTKDEVRSIMGHDPERRRAAADEETWFYITDYQREVNTVVTFRDGVVVEIDDAPWGEVE